MAAPDLLNLRTAIVATPPGLSGPERKAVAMLVDEVAARTQARLSVMEGWPEGDAPVIAVGQASAADFWPAAWRTEPGGPAEWATEPGGPPEGFRLCARDLGRRPVVAISGNDARGVLFGVGKLLRTLRLGRQRIDCPQLNITTAPRFSLRGHQLGYRPKTNSYDAWSLPVWEQYIRDLAVFGANAVELIPPRSDDAADSPHFPLPPLEMMVGMSQILADYGLSVWIWYPAMDPDYGDPQTVAHALAEWGEVFAALPRVDAVFVPGGDPGHTRPRYMMALLEAQAENLRRFHPNAGMWMSPQSFGAEWLAEWLADLRDEQPDWLAGVVYGPQVRVSLPELRAQVPERYPIRRYPDITHSRECQYAVPDWDLAYAATEGREGINPRPRSMAAIFRRYQAEAIGFLTYSEGCNDDVNKAVWSALGWDPDCDVVDALRDYSRYFIDAEYADTFAQSLLALEQNWRGPLAVNDGVPVTLRQFQAMERGASPAMLRNWRFQQALYRAYYDAYTRARLLYESELEERAMEALRMAPDLGALASIEVAEAHLRRAVTDRAATDWRARVFELAEALFQSIGMQLSVERCQAIAVDRGANLDSIDAPLNNRVWLLERFDEIGRLANEEARLAAIEAVMHWTDPGPGGFYEEPGNPARRPHLLTPIDPDGDPGSYASARTGFSDPHGRHSWARHVETLYDTPLEMRFNGLDPTAAYLVRVVFGGDSPGYGDDDPEDRIRLVGNGAHEVHGWIAKPALAAPVEHAVPREATAAGTLTLTWLPRPGRGGNGRGLQLSEVWLLRE